MAKANKQIEHLKARAPRPACPHARTHGPPWCPPQGQPSQQGPLVLLLRWNCSKFVLVSIGGRPQQASKEFGPARTTLGATAAWGVQNSARALPAAPQASLRDVAVVQNGAETETVSAQLVRCATDLCSSRMVRSPADNTSCASYGLFGRGSRLKPANWPARNVLNGSWCQLPILARHWGECAPAAPANDED